jgi:hypothetical protein
MRRKRNIHIFGYEVKPKDFDQAVKLGMTIYEYIRWRNSNFDGPLKLK